MGNPEIFKEPLSGEILRRLADETFGDMIKFVVDLEEKVLCAGGGLHSDEEALLLEAGSRQEDLWGGNFYPDLPGEEKYEYTSMINIRPRQNNRKQDIESLAVRQHVRALAGHFFEKAS